MGALDFAGGTVVHITSGVSRWCAPTVLGKRLGFGKEKMDPHDLTMTVLGAGLLLVRLVRLQRRQRPRRDGSRRNAFVGDRTSSAAMAALSWMTVSWMPPRPAERPRRGGGAVAGLVRHHAGRGLRRRSAAIAIGFGSAVILLLRVDLLKRRSTTRSMSSRSTASAASGVRSPPASSRRSRVNEAGNDGLLYGNPQQLLIQIVAVAASAAFAAIVTVAILKVIDLVIGLRVPEQEEVLGLDTTQHGEAAYQL
jgi:Amt family ammonium transporter